MLATGSMDRTVGLWQRKGTSFQKVLTFSSPTGPVSALCFHPDGQELADLMQNEPAVRVWHLDRLRKRLASIGLAW